MFKCSKCRKETKKQGYCTECQKDYAKRYRLKHGQKQRSDMRICERCFVEKGKDEFHGYQKFCKACTKPRGGNRSKYTTNEERIAASKESRKRYVQKPEVKAWQNKKKNDWNKAHRDKLNAIQAKYRETHGENKDAKTARRHRRRALEQSAGSFTAKEWRQLQERYNHTCLHCGCTECKLTPDHVIPLSKGGSNTIDNIQPLCLRCNVSKGVQSADYRY